jgi:hypothetical protein
VSPVVAGTDSCTYYFGEFEFKEYRFQATTDDTGVCPLCCLHEFSQVDHYGEPTGFILCGKCGMVGEIEAGHGEWL